MHGLEYWSIQINNTEKYNPIRNHVEAAEDLSLWWIFYFQQDNKKQTIRVERTKFSTQEPVS